MMNKIEQNPCLDEMYIPAGWGRQTTSINIINKSLHLITRISAVGEIQQHT